MYAHWKNHREYWVYKDDDVRTRKSTGVHSEIYTGPNAENQWNEMQCRISWIDTWLSMTLTFHVTIVHFESTPYTEYHIQYGPNDQ
jgi:hypothetical protein